MKGPGQNIHELTRVEAFLLSEKAGHPSHMHDFFWTQAEAIVRQRVAIVDFAVKTSEESPAETKPKPKTITVRTKKPAATPLPLGDKPIAAKTKATRSKPIPVAASAKKKTSSAAGKAAAKPPSQSK